jgi:dTMP kinase
MDYSIFKNKLIVACGSEEKGKSSVCKLLVDDLNAHGIETIFSFQPGDVNWGPLAPMLRSLCKDKRWNLHPLSNLWAFMLDRSEVITKVVTPALEAGKTIVSDRWAFSSIAYQLNGKQLIEKYHIPENICEWLSKEICRVPDYVYYFKDKVGQRINDKNDAFDNAEREFFDRVDSTYDRLAEEQGWLQVTAGSSANETLQNLYRITTG